MSERHEADHLDGRAVRRLAGIALAVLLLVFGAAHAYWRHLFPPVPPVAALPPEPRLQIHAPEDLARMRAAQQARLEHYAWTDDSHAAAQVPIGRAMQLLAQQGRALDDTPAEPPP